MKQMDWDIKLQRTSDWVRKQILTSYFCEENGVRLRRRNDKVWMQAVVYHHVTSINSSRICAAYLDVLMFTVLQYFLPVTGSSSNGTIHGDRLLWQSSQIPHCFPAPVREGPFISVIWVRPNMISFRFYPIPVRSRIQRGHSCSKCFHFNSSTLGICTAFW